eukprot:6216837-Prymnesium_polylepis.1
MGEMQHHRELRQGVASQSHHRPSHTWCSQSEARSARHRARRAWVAARLKRRRKAVARVRCQASLRCERWRLGSGAGQGWPEGWAERSTVRRARASRISTVSRSSRMFSSFSPIRACTDGSCTPSCSSRASMSARAVLDGGGAG